MFGNIKIDQNLVVRGELTFMSNPSFRQSQFVGSPQITTAKLDGLYYTDNMPVVFTRAGQPNAFQSKQVGARNLGLSQILFPKRMPYDVMQ